MDAAAAAGSGMISGNLRIWGFLRWKQRFFELDSAEMRLCARALPSSLVPLRVYRTRGARVSPRGVAPWQIG